MLTAILRSLRTGVVTERYPAQPQQPPTRFRGAPQIRPGVASVEIGREFELSARSRESLVLEMDRGPTTAPLSYLPCA
jgi:hypothetical protein